MNTNNTQTKVFDLPTRLFHWVFAALFIGAFAIGKFVDDEAAIYPYHMMMGILAIFALGLRIIWGVFGTKYARFSSFKLNPMALLDYFKSVFAGNKKPTLERNPASSFAAFAMFALVIALGISGYLMATSSNESQMHDIKEVHEVIAILFLVIVIAHIIGIIIHTIKQKDPIGLSMITGEKSAVAGETGIGNNHSIIGILFLILMGGSTFALANNYDAQNRKLNLFGQSLQLGENEGAEGNEHGEAEQENESDEDRD
jgi:cytochrome b